MTGDNVRPMTGSSESNRERWYASAVIAAAGLAWVAGSHFPDQRLWGINHLAFLPVAARIVLGIALAATLMIVWSVPLHPALSHKTARERANPLTPVLMIGWMMTAILVHAATPLLGDGYLRGDEIRRLTTVSFGVAEFLPGWLATTLHQGMLTKIDLEGTKILAGLSAASGMIFAVGALFLWPRALTTGDQTPEKQSPHRLLSVFWLLTAGSSVMFFGYVESYGLALASLSLFALAVLAHSNGRLGWGWPVFLWIAALWSHLSALGWAPVLLYAMYARRRQNRPVALPLSAAIGAVVGSLAIMRWLVPSSPTTIWGGYLLPLFGSPYSMLHWRHWVDAANHVILLLPASLLLIQMGRKGKRKSDPQLLTSVLLWAPAVLALFTFNPKLGWWRDWDLFALLSAPAVVALAIALARKQSTWPLPRRVAAVGLALISLTLWTWVNANERAAAARFESLLAVDPDRALSGYENLGRYWRETGDWEQSVRVLGTALALQGHARLFTQRGIGFTALGMADSALASFRKAVAADSTDASGYFGCGQMLWMMSKPDEALPYLRKAVAMDSTSTQYRYELGQVLRRTGDLRGALPHLAFASEQVPEQPVFANDYAATLFDAGDADAAVAVLQTTIKRHPAFSLAYSNLGWILYTKGDVAGAEVALAEYERQVRPEEHIPTVRRLRYVLDSLQTATTSEPE